MTVQSQEAHWKQEMHGQDVMFGMSFQSLSPMAVKKDTPTVHQLVHMSDCVCIQARQ